jgi:hypothetical protein
MQEQAQAHAAQSQFHWQEYDAAPTGQVFWHI